MKTTLALTLVLALSVATAQAATTMFVEIAHEVDIDGSLFNVWEMQVTTTSDWTNARLDVNLAVGNFFASPFGATQEPTSGLKGALPNLEYDTWLTVPGGGGVEPVPMVQAGDIIMPTSTGQQTQIGASWGNTDTTDIGTFSIAQLTLSVDAKAGSGDPRVAGVAGIAFDVDSAGVGNDIVHPQSGLPYYIEGGMIIPEPATLCLLALGLPLLRRRK